MAITCTKNKFDRTDLQVYDFSHMHLTYVIIRNFEYDAQNKILSNFKTFSTVLLLMKSYFSSLLPVD